jgi:AcrR family transcriptional regulator
LVTAARNVFEARGYDNTRVDDIANAASYAAGTFYTHFASKEEVFGEVLQQLSDEPPPLGPAATARAPEAAHEIHEAVARYFDAYARDGRRWAVLEEGLIRGSGDRKAPLARARRYRDAWLRPLTAWQRDGVIDAGVPLRTSVAALLAMTEWVNALQRVYGYSFPQPTSVGAVSEVWQIALGLRAPQTLRGARTAKARLPSPAFDDPRLGHPYPGLGPKAARTRDELVAASRRLFSHSRLADVGVRDIAAEAGVSVGSFYKYFRSKEDVLEEVLAGVQRDLLAPRSDHPGAPMGTVRVANQAWFEQVRGHAGLWRTLSEAAITTPSITEVWARRRYAYTLRLEAAFGRWQAAGLVECPLGARLSAVILGAMTERVGHVWFVLGDAPPSMANAVTGVTALWLRVLGDASAGPARP